MSQLQEIYEGWKNLLFENPKVEKIAKERIKICVGCTKLKSNNSCEICGCYMPAKTRSMGSHCPDEPPKW